MSYKNSFSRMNPELVKSEVIPKFLDYLERALGGKRHTRDSELDKAALKHAESMAERRMPYSAPMNFLDGALEINFCHSARDIDSALIEIAYRLRQENNDSKNLKECNRMGLGIVVLERVKMGRKFLDLYITQRIKPW